MPSIKIDVGGGRIIRAEHLMGNADLAQYFGSKSTAVSAWYTRRERTGMPEPVAVISSKIRVWDGPAVLDWWETWTGRRLEGQAPMVMSQARTGYRIIKAGDLMGLADLAAYFDVKIATASNWNMYAVRYGMPAPIRTVSGYLSVWDGPEVVDWWKAWKPRKRSSGKAGTLPEDRAQVASVSQRV